MASDTVPAAVPGPNTPPDSTATPLPAPSGTQQPADGLAGLLAPVQPVRATFNMTPDQTAEMADGEQEVTDASSAGFNTENTPENSGEKGKKTAAGKQEKSVVRAWLLAGAERWRKGADTRNKRLDVKKARAQARQIKETVTVNRSNAGGGGLLGGGKSSSSGGGKGGGGKDLSSKTRKTPSNGPKNSTPSNSASGRTNGGGRGTGSGGGRSEKTAHPKPSNSGKGGKDTARKAPGTGNSGSGGGAAGKGSGGKDTAAHRKPSSDKGGHKPAKDHARDGQRTNGTGSGSGTGGKAGAQGPAGKPGKDANSGKDRPWKNRTPHAVDLNKDKPKRTDGKGQDRQAGGKTPKPGDGDGTTPAVKTPKTTDAKDTPKKATDKPAPSGKDQTAGSGKDPKKQQPTSPNPAPRVDTRSSREAGYRDGTRVGKVVAHTQAYRDGYRDGRTDTAQAAARDKQRLDQAHTQRKQTRTQPDKDQPVTQPIPPQPTHAPGPQPVPVNRVDSTHIHLGPGANRTSISRGEVRRLCDFQKRLTHKKDRLVIIADATRTLEEHAKEQAKKITQLLEQARGVKGGQKLVAALTKLNEAATLQAGKAGEINRRALRSLEACKSLAGNTEARYGGIYKAVVDSPETSPAEMKYYREMGYANV